MQNVRCIGEVAMVVIHFTLCRQLLSLTDRPLAVDVVGATVCALVLVLVCSVSVELDLSIMWNDDDSSTLTDPRLVDTVGLCSTLLLYTISAVV